MGSNGFEGVWNVLIESPVGDQSVRFEIRIEDGKMSGTASLGPDEAPFLEPVLEGDRLRWSMDITKPMAMTLKFDVTCAGDTLKGTAKAGFFISMAVAGNRSPTK